jgi:hypothetical protein
MIAAEPSDNGYVTHQAKLVGKCLYSPGAVAGYCVFATMPVGLILYGLNLCRRGKVWNGRLLIILAIMVMCYLLIISFSPNRSGFGGILFPILSIFVGIGLYKKEKPVYERAIAHGAIRAKWWPPLLYILIILLALGITLSIIQ